MFETDEEKEAFLSRAITTAYFGGQVLEKIPNQKAGVVTNMLKKAIDYL